MKNRVLSLAVLTAASGIAVPSIAAEPDEAGQRRGETLDEVIVFGRAENLIGEAPAASEGTVGGSDLSVRPLLRVAELLEVVPGLIAAQHSGSGKANQYFLRGFNLDHGTDFTTYFDDVPLNMRTHGHGQGYLDVNGLIPEVVERIDYRKGTYRADVGDFSIAGSALMHTVDSLDNFVAAETGEFGWLRFAGGGSVDIGDGQLSFVAQYKGYDGPWELPEDLQHQSAWAKYGRPTDFGRFEFSFSAYHAEWRPTEQIPENAIGSSACEDEFCALDTTATGETERYIAVANFESESWRASLYGQYYNWHMFSNPTYDPDATDDPAGQIDQFDRRVVLGGRYERTLLDTDRWTIKAGAEGRYDDVPRVGFDSTADGVLVANVADNAVTESSLAAYTEVSFKVTGALRINGGLRADWYDFDVKVNEASGAQGQDNVGSTSDDIVSPKLGIAYAIGDSIELYGNWGEGFHSNDARGVNKNVDPVPGLVRGTGYELGARFEVGDFRLTTTYWWLSLESELIFVGDDNTVEPKGSSHRRGYEVVAFWRPIEWLGIDAVYAHSRARYDNEQDGGGRFIEQGVESAGELGIAATQDNWEFGARLRYLGEYPLLPDNSQRADEEINLNLRGAYTIGAFTLYAEVLNVFDRDGKDVVYFYETNVPGIGLDEGRVSRAQEPRTVRGGVKFKF